MKLNSLTPSIGSIKDRKRKGRGTGSGKGGTSTRGHKGAGSRSGYSAKRSFEGGQMPLQRRLPKFGFKNFNRISYKAINLDDIQKILDTDLVKIVDIEYFRKHGMVSKNDLVKILGRGELKSKVEIVANSFSESALSAISQVGGVATLTR